MDRVAQEEETRCQQLMEEQLEVERRRQEIEKLMRIDEDKRECDAAVVQIVSDTKNKLMHKVRKGDNVKHVELVRAQSKGVERLKREKSREVLKIPRERNSPSPALQFNAEDGEVVKFFLTEEDDCNSYSCGDYSVQRS